MNWDHKGHAMELSQVYDLFMSVTSVQSVYYLNFLMFDGLLNKWMWFTNKSQIELILIKWANPFKFGIWPMFVNLF
jgi:hypothetical protein